MAGLCAHGPAAPGGDRFMLAFQMRMQVHSLAAPAKIIRSDGGKLDASREWLADQQRLIFRRRNARIH